MSFITKQPNGRYRARYRDLNGRTRSQTFDRKIDAKAFLDAAGADMRRGEWVDPTTRRETFDAWADRWWSTTVKLRPTSRRTYWDLLQLHVRPAFTGRRIVDIDYLDVESFLADRLAAGLSPKRVREALSVLSLIMKCAVRSGVRRDNPAAGHELPIRRRKVRQGDVLDMPDVHRLIEHVQDPYKPAVWLFVMAGLRPAELCGLRVRSVDFVRRIVHITETLLPVCAFDGNPHQMAVEGPPKTEAGNRSIPISASLCDELAAMLAIRAADRGVNQIPPDDRLFVTPTGLPLHRDRFRRSIVRPALRAAGLPEEFRTYDLRHTHASLLIDSGANVLAVAQRMGHSDPAVTLREYGHLFEGVQERLTEQLEAIRQIHERVKWAIRGPSRPNPKMMLAASESYSGPGPFSSLK